jgi:hypothetical protein
VTARTTTHTLVRGGYLRQLDLPHHPGRLVAIRTVEANVPRITRDWLICHGPVTFEVMLPDDLTVGAVVEWVDQPAETLDDHEFTVITALTATSVTFARYGTGPDGALAAARAASRLRAAADRAARAVYTRVYRAGGHRAHLREEHSSGPVLCAPHADPDPDAWRGTGSQAEHDHAARLMLCRACTLRRDARNMP